MRKAGKIKLTVLDDGGQLASQLELDQKVVSSVEVKEGDNVLLADSIRKELLGGPFLSRGGHCRDVEVGRCEGKKSECLNGRRGKEKENGSQ